MLTAGTATAIKRQRPSRTTLRFPEFLPTERAMTARARLPNCRASVTFTFWCNSLLYTATVSYFANGDLAEIFLQNAKAGSHSDAAAKDSAVVCSIALQYGVPVDVIRKALLRDFRGVASSPLGCALDMLTANGEAANDRA